jgi:osmotically-inducible protein OsmY
MNTLRPLLIALLLTNLSACGSFLSAVDAPAIEDDPGERTYGATVEDESIETKGKVNISASDEQFDSAHFGITSYNGYVLLAGQVPSEALKQKASDVVRKIRGVRRIYNELEVRGNTSAMTRSSDTWLTTKVKSAMLANEQIQASRVKIVTENGVVFLMGLVTRSEAQRAADTASASAGVQKVVQLFEYID